MKNVTKHTGKLNIVERMKNSVNGNPRYSCFLVTDTSGNGVSFITPADSSYSYTVKNYEGKQVIVTLGTHYGKCMLDSIEEVKQWN